MSRIDLLKRSAILPTIILLCRFSFTPDKQYDNHCQNVEQTAEKSNKIEEQLVGLTIPQRR